MSRSDPARFDVPNGTHRDGKPMNGALHVSHEVHCAGCEQPSLGLSHLVSIANAQLRREGWRRRGGLWRCGGCSKRIS